MKTLRPHNRCSQCSYTWYPRGKNISLRCPSCGSTDVKMTVGCLSGPLVLGVPIFMVFMMFGSTTLNLVQPKPQRVEPVKQPVSELTPAQKSEKRTAPYSARDQRVRAQPAVAGLKLPLEAEGEESDGFRQGRPYDLDGLTYQIVSSEWCGAIEYRGQISRPTSNYMIVSLVFKNNDTSLRQIHMLDLRDESGASISRSRDDVLDGDGDLTPLAMVNPGETGAGKLFFDCEEERDYALIFTALGGKVLASVRLQPTDIVPEPRENTPVVTQNQAKPISKIERPQADSHPQSFSGLRSKLGIYNGIGPITWRGPSFIGPRGGVYHFSKNGKKVYEKKR